MLPVYGWRGGAADGTTARGTYLPCRLTSDACVMVVWPEKGLTPYYSPTQSVTWTTWFGSQIKQMTDGSGLMYMRNRYYSPESGTFTQSDPIGLAGGINAYGFANGDPVSYSDPYGLCIWDLCVVEGAVTIGAVELSAGVAATVLAASPSARRQLSRGLDVVAAATAAGRQAAAGLFGSGRHAQGIERVRKHIEVANEHLDQIGGLGPDDEDPDGKKRDWLNHARRHVRLARQDLARVLGRTQEELGKAIDTVEQRIDQIANSH